MPVQHLAAGEPPRSPRAVVQAAVQQGGALRALGRLRGAEPGGAAGAEGDQGNPRGRSVRACGTSSVPVPWRSMLVLSDSVKLAKWRILIREFVNLL